VTNAAVETRKGPRYEVNLDGEIFEWPNPTITVPEIRDLAGWGDDQPVVMVDLKTNDERDLREDEVISLKPGQGFSKKVKFKRGAR
jgi:hypothetical protein